MFLLLLLKIILLWNDSLRKRESYKFPQNSQQTNQFNYVYIDIFFKLKKCTHCILSSWLTLCFQNSYFVLFLFLFNELMYHCINSPVTFTVGMDHIICSPIIVKICSFCQRSIETQKLSCFTHPVLDEVRHSYITYSILRHLVHCPLFLVINWEHILNIKCIFPSPFFDLSLMLFFLPFICITSINKIGSNDDMSHDSLTSRRHFRLHFRSRRISTNILYSRAQQSNSTTSSLIVFTFPHRVIQLRR